MIIRTALVILLLIVSFPAHARSETSGSIGGILINDDDITLTGSLKYINDTGPREISVEADAIYRTGNDRTAREQVNAFIKLNQDIHPSHYIQASVRYRHDSRSFSQDQVAYTVGHGYRIIRNDRTRLSNELSVGYKHGSDGYSEFIVRDSIWLSHKLSKTTTVSNKFLIEQGNRTFIQNRLEVSFRLTENTTFKLQDIYTRDSRNDNTMSFAIGFRF